MASEADKTSAYRRGIEGKSGARSGFSIRLPDKDEKKAYEQGRREKIRQDNQRKNSK